MKTLATLIACLMMGLTVCYSQAPKETYRCKPCDLPCDSLTFSNPGSCPHCSMRLHSTDELRTFNNLSVNDINIVEGSGIFLIEGGVGHKEKTIEIYYHKPKNFTSDSKILMVIPGAGRDADEYRDSWIEASEKYNVLILSPRYAEKTYDFGAYHLGGLLYNLNLDTAVTFEKNSNRVVLDEAKFKYNINANAEEWIFNDFDRLFTIAVDATGSNQKKYDLFGHSAGAQILHRFVLFHPQSQANRILASNSGFYTLPNFDVGLPFGFKDAPVKTIDLALSFKSNLVLFLGELDNQNESGGLMLRSPTVDKQGIHRLERGKYFYEAGKEKAREINADFNWELVTIPKIGHDFRKMAVNAAAYLYNDNEQ